LISFEETDNWVAGVGNNGLVANANQQDRQNVAQECHCGIRLFDKVAAIEGGIFY
jgi:hypothetical protein